MEKEFKKTLVIIQSELKAPKNQINKFGGYSYRSAEDILESVKPLCSKYNMLLYINDEVVNIGDRFYVKATASITDGVDIVSVSAFAREEETKKGQDGAQITGSASSYARKYALNGLFCIDDTKDPDGTNTHGANTPAPAPRMAPAPASAPANDLDLQTACNDAKSAKTVDALHEVWNNWKGLQANPVFKKTVIDLKKKFK